MSKEATVEETSKSTFFVIERGFQEGKQLTKEQKTSALFSEEPVVMGRTLRRGTKPMRISSADYKANELQLLRLEKAGAIKITRPEEVMTKPCELCGQTPRGQSGDFQCPKCGLPMTFDPATLNPVVEVLQTPAPEQIVEPTPAAPEVVPETPATVVPETPAPEKKEEVIPVPEKPKSTKTKK